MSTLLAPGWVNTLTSAIANILNPVLILVAVAGVFYAIYVGFKFAKAEDKSARDEAKQKLISVIVGIVVTGLLIALFYWLKWMLENGKINFDNWYDKNSVVSFYVNGVKSMFIK
ncbi:MAG: hypothetical protein IKM43_01120 [Clostridia bacterium]|nr:hypothetical protein [Clostridia bacterium]